MFIGSSENDVLIGGNGNSYAVNSEAVLKINNALSNGKK